LIRMRLRYLGARNVLSFGDEGIELQFSPFNIIVGPNDSGKTNVFRALNLIKEAFDRGKPAMDEILFNGERDRSVHLEVGVELDDTEVELIATQMICHEMVKVIAQPDASIKGITENKLWKSILSHYGYPIISRSLRRVSFILTRDELDRSKTSSFAFSLDIICLFPI